MKIIGGLRPSLFGDVIASLPFLTYLEKIYPGSYKAAYIDKKCAQIIPFLINHPLIDKIYISEEKDRVSLKDNSYFETFNMVFEPYGHVVPEGWWNFKKIVEQSFCLNFLRGHGYINPSEWNQLSSEEQKPKLYQWFDVEKNNKFIALWPFTGYANNDLSIDKRSPNMFWWRKLANLLKDQGFEVLQYGHPNSPLLWDGVIDRRKLSLFDAVKETLGCDCHIGTDSGSSWILGAYGMKQILLYTNYKENHYQNFDAFLPINLENNLKSLFDLHNINNINQEEILNLIK